MTDPSLQKMQTTPESNVQKMHISAEWVEAAFAAYDDAAVPDCGTSHHGIKAALSAVIHLIREDERERLAETAERDGLRYERPLWDGSTCIGLDGPNSLSDWLRAQGRE